MRASRCSPLRLLLRLDLLDLGQHAAGLQLDHLLSSLHRPLVTLRRVTAPVRARGHGAVRSTHQRSRLDVQSIGQILAAVAQFEAELGRDGLILGTLFTSGWLRFCP